MDRRRPRVAAPSTADPSAPLDLEVGNGGEHHAFGAADCRYVAALDEATAADHPDSNLPPCPLTPLTIEEAAGRLRGAEVDRTRTWSAPTKDVERRRTLGGA